MSSIKFMLSNQPKINPTISRVNSKGTLLSSLANQSQHATTSSNTHASFLDTRSNHSKLCIIALLVTFGYYFSSPAKDLDFFAYKEPVESSGQGQFFYYKPDESRDWFPTG